MSFELSKLCMKRITFLCPLASQVLGGGEAGLREEGKEVRCFPSIVVGQRA